MPGNPTSSTSQPTEFARTSRETLRRHHGFLAAERDGRGVDLRADSARRAPRARPDVRGRHHESDCPEPAAQPADRPREHDVSRHHRRAGSADPRKDRPEMPDRARRRPPKTSPPISISLFRPSAKTPATSNTAWRKFPRSSAESILQAAARRRACTRRLFRRSCRSARRAPPKWPSCSKTSSAA